MANVILTYNNRIIDYTSVVPFSPLDYTPIAWYDSSDVSTITKDISDKVSEWRDKSGLGYHLVQSVDLNKPIYSGGTGIVFDGVNDYFITNITNSYNQPITIISVYYCNSLPNGGVVVSLPSTYYKYAIYATNGSSNLPRIYISDDAGNVIYIPSSEYLPPYKAINTSIINGNNSKIYLNNVLKATGSQTIQPFTGNLQIGRTSYDGGSGNFKGPIKEIIIYNSALTTDQITTVNNYLNQKYNIY